MTAIGTPQTILGNEAAVEQGTKYTWNYFSGEGTVLTFKGTAAQVLAAYNSYKNVAGFNPDVESLSFDAGRGLAALEVAKVEDGAKLYELFAMEDRVAVESADYYQASDATDGAALSTAEVNAVFAQFNSLSTVAGSGWRTKQTNLWTQLSRGETEVFMTRFALRETQRVSKRSTVSAAHATVDTVEAPPSTSAVNTLIGELPAGEWLRRGTVVRTVGARRWEVITEWWWALKWSRVHYGGTLEP